MTMMSEATLWETRARRMVAFVNDELALCCHEDSDCPFDGEDDDCFCCWMDWLMTNGSD
jgi:hypothetical protein